MDCGSVAPAQSTGHPVTSQFVMAALGIPHAAHSCQENHFLGVSTLLLLASGGVCSTFLALHFSHSLLRFQFIHLQETLKLLEN